MTVRYFIGTTAGIPIRDVPAAELRSVRLTEGTALYFRTASGKRQVYGITNAGRALYKKACGRITSNPEDR